MSSLPMETANVVNVQCIASTSTSHRLVHITSVSPCVCMCLIESVCVLYVCACSLSPRSQPTLIISTKKPFIIDNSLASHASLGLVYVATPSSLPLPHYPLCGNFPCALLRGSGCWGGVGLSGVHLPPAVCGVFSPSSCAPGWPVYSGCVAGSSMLMDGLLLVA